MSVQEKEPEKFSTLDSLSLSVTGVSGLYALEGHSYELDVFISTSDFGCSLLTSPEIVGSAYQSMLRRAVQVGLESLCEFKPDVRTSMSDTSVDVLYFLRGGLNFGTHVAVEELTGRPSRVHFLSVSRDLSGVEVRIVDDAYRRIDGISSGNSLVIADIAATGSTINRAIDIIVEQRESLPECAASTPWQVVFVLIATVESLPVIAAATDKLRAAFATARPVRASVVVLEGLFRLHDPGAVDGRGGIGTDFVRRNGIMTPDYLAACLQTPSSLFEGCVIYDGGQRGFSPADHFAAVAEYWDGLERRMRNAGKDEQRKLIEASDAPVADGRAEAYAVPWASLPAETSEPVVRAMAEFAAGVDHATILTAFERRLALLRSAGTLEGEGRQ
ncbi:phosphoribosyltransferase [Streptomyces canus]|uniref:phosphoribosyltransferase n=1 Tax=Streptomyces canus TaxID=58343 RepID=UPI0033BD4007